MRLPDTLVDFDAVIEILDTYLDGAVADELFEKIINKIDMLPWYDGIHIEEDAYSMEEHKANKGVIEDDLS